MKQERERTRELEKPNRKKKSVRFESEEKDDQDEILNLEEFDGIKILPRYPCRKKKIKTGIIPPSFE